MGPPIVPVSVAKATQESVPTELRVVGTVEASAIVQVKSQVAGQLLQASPSPKARTSRRAICSSRSIRVLTKRPCARPKPPSTRDRAQIVAARRPTLARDAAQAKFNESDAARYAELQKAGVVSKSQSDQARTSADVARESARATQAGIDSAKAALDSDRLRRELRRSSI